VNHRLEISFVTVLNKAKRSNIMKNAAPKKSNSVRQAAITVGLSAALGGFVLSNVSSANSPAEAIINRVQQIVAKYDPVPAIAQGVAIPVKGYALEKLGDGIYSVSDGNYMTMFLTTGKGVIVVDAPPTTGQNILKAIAEVTKEPITHVVYSHAHADHIGAAKLFPKNAVIIAQEKTLPRLKAANDANRPLPTVTFKDKYTLKIGNQTLQLEYKGGNHTDDNIFVYAPRQKVLMVVDIIYPGWAPFRELAVSEDIPGWVKAHEQILEYPFEKLVAGHWSRIGTRQDVQSQIAYMRDLDAASRKALATVKFADVYSTLGGTDAGNTLAIFEAYLNALSDFAADDVIAKWRGKLGGVDVVTRDNAFKLIVSIRANEGSLGEFGLR
jgi:glyoxylase-like metal-dependent hydrolase (beta-lactamase superfamily II)